jgi:hypothetical protein
MTEVFKYMGWCKHKARQTYPKSACVKCGMPIWIKRRLDGNDMTLAINAMQDGDFEDFEQFTLKKYLQVDDVDKPSHGVWLFGNPTNFFRLMEEALTEGVIG